MHKLNGLLIDPFEDSCLAITLGNPPIYFLSDITHIPDWQQIVEVQKVIIPSLAA
jgi:hypothetical protein